MVQERNINISWPYMSFNFNKNFQKFNPVQCSTDIKFLCLWTVQSLHFIICTHSADMRSKQIHCRFNDLFCPQYILYSLHTLQRKKCSINNQWVHWTNKLPTDTCGSSILPRGLLQRPKIGNVVEWSCMSKTSYLWLGSRAHLRPKNFWGLNAQIYILPHSRASFSHQKLIYNLVANAHQFNFRLCQTQFV